MGFAGEDMKSSDFMDKRIVELSRSDSDEFSYEVGKDDFDSNFEFHSTRPIVPPRSRDFSFQVGTPSDGGLLSVIDLKMEEHFKNLIHVVEGISVRMCQLENRTRKIEYSVEELKGSSEFNHGKSGAKLRELENILTEVQGGIQDFRDKQETSQVQLQLGRLQMLKDYQKSQDQKTKIHTSSCQGLVSTVQQHNNQTNITAETPPQQFPVLSSVQQHSNQSNQSIVTSLQHFPPEHHNVPQIQSHQNLPPMPTAGQFLAQAYQNQNTSVLQAESNFSLSPPVFNSESTQQHHRMPPIQQPQSTSISPYQPYQQAPQFPLTSQLQPSPLLSPSHDVDPQTYPSLAHIFKEVSYMPPQSYSTSIHETYNAPGFAPPTKESYSSSHQKIGNNQPSRTSEYYYPEHVQPSRDSSFNDVYSHSGFPSQYSKSMMNSSEPPPFLSARDSENRFSQPLIPKALPRALPMASEVDSGSGSSENGNNIPIEDVIDNIVAMGFRRDLVRATVKKITENGQSVDLNVVLDKLMNNREVPNEIHKFGL
ncbi:uncharacterized protein LOC133830263 [Humulus lupulus]|uniref:uncharacterized protein LOC133830263 n=1 Tax=Humulus lupulus TaxID=3486 RepID=UPI002B4166CC|nr:uncharacterized protein LOC133830263 [Humulus lupulus]